MAHHVAFLEAGDDRKAKGMQVQPLHLPINCDAKALEILRLSPTLVRIQNIIATLQDSILQK